ncbi:ABC transporter ATP-binding protein [Xanthobacter tagetidis]|uniref:ABC transporter ATP-binding protein n=1 Tax=Xanthobacter tagetidis TaxID=60216 RepID=A0A3L7A1X9_9HYPH|nr:ABC transporter ATP-binding protein [Xanthobacter tagetidis]MBB6309273.1 branched-chain amino acid transport system ATP-binding protein [Xanthobacter tagetidis]RLP74229.1 ABC transporter ATP-binding protein [Xanthobacter tagetidis]
MSAPLLEARGLAKAYGGVEAVRDVSFTLAPGEMLALIGPNGAGKSTLFAMLGGQLRPDAGRVLLQGRDITRVPASGRFALGVGRTFQVAATFPSLSVRENVQTALLSRAGELFRLMGRADRSHRAEADALLGHVGLAGAADRAAGELAYGDVKRLELALALGNAPRLLLMDEPTAGMARAERADLMRLARDIARDRAIGVLFTEHDMEAVFGHADRILVLDRGALIAEGPPDAVRRDPKVRAVYLGEEAGP